MARLIRAAVAALVVALAASACTTSVAGRAVRATASTHPSFRARDLLLRTGDETPLGPATAYPVGKSYFVTTRPPECSAALLFEGSPLRPPNAADHAELAYRFGGPAFYAESVDVYAQDLDIPGMVHGALSAVSTCHGDATGVSRSGAQTTMRLTSFGTPADGVLVWTMTSPGWICDYGLTAVPRVALLLSTCDDKPGFPMADWASKRRAQLANANA